MLLAIDVGNTNITIGLFKGSKLIGEWRLSTNQQKTRDELGLRIKSLLQTGEDPSLVPDAIAISSVVPYLNKALQEGLKKYIGPTPVFLHPPTNGIIKINTDEPQFVGPDRIANCIAGWYKYNTSCLIIDFGTATSFDLVSENGEFLGGAIAPEMEIALQTLYKRAALIPEIELSLPQKVIGKTTSESLNSGFVLGFISLIEGMIKRFKREYSEKLRVMATGGKGEIFFRQIDEIEIYEEYLALEGLRIWWSKLYGMD